MFVTTSRIHSFYMLRLSVKPTRPASQWVRITRPGVNGVALWNTGSRAEPIIVQSIAPATDLEEALQRYKLYLDLVERPPVEVAFAGHQEAGIRYKVLEVHPLPGQIRPLLRGHFAGQAVNYQGWICCEWRLQPVKM